MPHSHQATPAAQLWFTWASNRSGDERFAQVYRRLGLHDKTLRWVALFRLHTSSWLL